MYVHTYQVVVVSSGSFGRSHRKEKDTKRSCGTDSPFTGILIFHASKLSPASVPACLDAFVSLPPRISYSFMRLQRQGTKRSLDRLDDCLLFSQLPSYPTVHVIESVPLSTR